jgi:hypothetical protein
MLLLKRIAENSHNCLQYERVLSMIFYFRIFKYRKVWLNTPANFIKQGVLYTQWPCHPFNMNNGYCMII